MTSLIGRLHFEIAGIAGWNWVSCRKGSPHLIPSAWPSPWSSRHRLGSRRKFCDSALLHSICQPRIDVSQPLQLTPGSICLGYLSPAMANGRVQETSPSAQLLAVKAAVTNQSLALLCVSVFMFVFMRVHRNLCQAYFFFSSCRCLWLIAVVIGFFGTLFFRKFNHLNMYICIPTIGVYIYIYIFFPVIGQGNNSNNKREPSSLKSLSTCHFMLRSTCFSFYPSLSFKNK